MSKNPETKGTGGKGAERVSMGLVEELVQSKDLEAEIRSYASNNPTTNGLEERPSIKEDHLRS
jgi:hypothetical protein